MRNMVRVLSRGIRESEFRRSFSAQVIQASSRSFAPRSRAHPGRGRRADPPHGPPERSARSSTFNTRQLRGGSSPRPPFSVARRILGLVLREPPSGGADRPQAGVQSCGTRSRRAGQNVFAFPVPGPTTDADPSRHPPYIRGTLPNLTAAIPDPPGRTPSPRTRACVHQRRGSPRGDPEARPGPQGRPRARHRRRDRLAADPPPGHFT
jgi:hypothetical protein